MRRAEGIAMETEREGIGKGREGKLSITGMELHARTYAYSLILLVTLYLFAPKLQVSGLA